MTPADAQARWSTVLFDLDGTLADTIGLILDCFRHTMRAHLGEPPPDSEWLDTMGAPLRDQIAGFARSEDEAAAMFESYVTYQRTIHDERVRPFPGTIPLLEELRACGAAIGIVTGKRRELALRTLRVCGFGERYDLLVSADDAEPGKPDPAPVRVALRGLDRPAGDAIFIGDSPLDIASGRAAGVATAAVLWGPFQRATLDAAGPDHVLESLMELRALLRDSG